jgi:hypothetical protein
MTRTARRRAYRSASLAAWTLVTDAMKQRQHGRVAKTDRVAHQVVILLGGFARIRAHPARFAYLFSRAYGLQREMEDVRAESALLDRALS